MLLILAEDAVLEGSPIPAFKISFRCGKPVSTFLHLALTSDGPWMQQPESIPEARRGAVTEGPVRYFRRGDRSPI